MEKRYFAIDRYGRTTYAHTLKQWLSIGLHDTKEWTYYVFEPEKLQEVNMRLIVENV